MLHYKFPGNSIIDVDYDKKKKFEDNKIVQKMVNSKKYNIVRKIEKELSIIPKNMIDDDMKHNIIDEVEKIGVSNLKKLKQVIHSALTNLEYNELLQFFSSATII